MPKKDDPQADVQRIRNAEIRATVCRETRRGLTQRNIAGALGISVSQVQKILAEDLAQLLRMDDEDREAFTDFPMHGEVTLDMEDRELQDRFKEERRKRTDELIKIAESRPPDAPIPPDPFADVRDVRRGPAPNPEKLQAKPYTVTNFPHDKALVHYSYDNREQLDSVRRKVFLLRKEGKSYQEIEDLTGVAPNEAKRWVTQELGVLDADELHNRDLARRLQLERFDSLLSACWASATRKPTPEFPMLGPDLEAVRTVLRVMEQQAKLLGLNAPAKIDIEERIRLIARRNDMPEEELIEYTRLVMEQRLVLTD